MVRLSEANAATLGLSTGDRAVLTTQRASTEVVVPDRADAARGPALVERPDALAVQADVVRARLLGLEPRDVDEREVMALDLERPVGAAADLDLAGPVGLDPHRRVLRADMAQERAEDEASHAEVRAR